MKKNILFLINGFGVEKADSYNIYSDKLMPNMDKLTKENIFVSISNNHLDYKAAYRNFSMGINNPLTYNLIDNNINSGEMQTNQVIRYIANEVNKKKSRLHIVCYWDSNKTCEQLTTYVREFSNKTQQRIFIHVILCQKSVNDYKEILKGLSSLSYDMNPNIRIGIITGENNMKGILQVKDVVKSFVTEFGEKWKNLDKKVEVLTQNKTAPYEVRTFSVDSAFKVENNDQILIFNYNHVDLTLFKNEFENQKYRELDYDSIKFYSLFPIKCGDEQIHYMYNYAVAANYFLNSLKTAKLKCLVMDEKDHCGYINYYLTGLRNTVDNDLKYLPSEDEFLYDGSKLIEKIKLFKDKDIFIINYDISDAKLEEDIETKLAKIDKVIGEIYNFVKENKYALIITSMFGLEREIYNKKQELLKINFSGKSPLIIYDSDINLNNYSISDGSLYDLSNTILWSLNKSYKDSGLVRKKSGLLSFFHKK